MRRLLLGLVGVPVAFVCCGDSGGGGSSGAPGDAGGLDAAIFLQDAPSDAPVSDGGPPAPALKCKEGGPARTLMARPSNDAGTLLWDPKVRIVRIGPQLARVVARAEWSDVADVLSFDPTNPSGAVTHTTFPLDYLLEIERGDASLDVYGVRLADADGGASAQLVLVSIADADGAVTELALTPPGGIATPSRNHYEPPMGRFVRLGPSDVYFTYTEEVPPVNNPTYRLSVGRRTASSSSGVVPTQVGTAGPHKFQGITISALTHVGSSMFLFTGASGITASDNGPSNSAELSLPDVGGGTPASVSFAASKQVLAIGAPAAGARPFAFFDAPDTFASPQYFVAAEVNDTDVAKIAVPGSDVKLLHSSSTIGVDSHFEGAQFLMFGPDRLFWYDVGTRSARMSGAVQPSLTLSNVHIGSMTFASPPTATTGALDLAMVSTAGDDLVYVALGCGP